MHNNKLQNYIINYKTQMHQNSASSTDRRELWPSPPPIRQFLRPPAAEWMEVTFREEASATAILTIRREKTTTTGRMTGRHWLNGPLKGRRKFDRSLHCKIMSMSKHCKAAVKPSESFESPSRANHAHNCGAARGWRTAQTVPSPAAAGWRSTCVDQRKRIVMPEIPLYIYYSYFNSIQSIILFGFKHNSLEY